MAPEVFTETASVGAKTDIYSFGIVMFEIMTETLPYSGFDIDQIAYRVVNMQQRPDDFRSVVYKPDRDKLIQLMQQCWRQTLMNALLVFKAL